MKTPLSDEDAIEATLLRLAAARTAGATLCPSEAARALATDWRPLMPAVRAIAARLVAQGKLRCTQRGRPADPLTARGPVRLARPSRAS
jgi:hypothetical protein